MSELKSPQIEAQEDYDRKLALLKGLHGKDNLLFELDAHDYLGHNSLQLLLNKFGQYDAGWVDEAEFDDVTKNRIVAFNRQDIVSTNAITKSLLKRTDAIEKNVNFIKWTVIAVALLNILVLIR